MRLSEIAKSRPVPTIGYHVTAARNVKRIGSEGIKGAKIFSQSKGHHMSPVYFWDTLEMARWFTRFQNDSGEKRVILTVDLSGLPLEPDPEAQDMSEWSSRFQPGEDGGAWMTYADVTPERIHRGTNRILESFGTTASLFHGTSLDDLMAIIHADKFAPGHGMTDTFHLGISLTRSPQIAKDFAKAHEENFSFDVLRAHYGADTVDVGHHGAIIEFDRAKLARAVELSPVEWGDDDEQEERTHGPIKPALAFVRAIFVNREDLKRYLKAVEDHFEDDLKANVKNAFKKLKASGLLRFT